MAEMPTLAGTVRLPAPVFLRKLRRKADWGSSETPLEQRAADVPQLVFKIDPKPYSLFKVESDEELQRVVIGLNGGRPSLTCDSDFIAILPCELAAAGIYATRTAGDTLCRFANALHYDIPAEDSQLLALCRGLIGQGRQVIHFTKGMTRPLAAIAQTDSCLAVPDSPGCRLARCAD